MKAAFDERDDAIKCTPVSYINNLIADMALLHVATNNLIVSIE
jgi:hypothetical protein